MRLMSEWEVGFVVPFRAGFETGILIRDSGIDAFVQKLTYTDDSGAFD